MELKTPVYDKLVGYIGCYLSGECPLRQLETWLLSNLQFIIDSNDATATELANKIDTDLVELGEGLTNESSFREHLSKYMQVANSVILKHKETEQADETIITGSSIETFTVEKEGRGSVVDAHLVLSPFVV